MTHNQHIPFLLMLLFAIACASFQVFAQDNDSLVVAPSILYAPLVFDNQMVGIDDSTALLGPANDVYRLDAGDQWLNEAIGNSRRINHMRYRTMVSNPQLVPYNLQQLPQAPPEGIIAADPRQGMLSVPHATPPAATEAPITTPELRIHNWLHVFNASLQFTQAYISGNWYQGGENNMALLADVQWDCNLNQDVHPNWLFANTLHYKLGIASTRGDSIRDYLINEDNFLFTSQLGYKAIKNWYYSAKLQFTTQFLNNYKTNTRTMTAAFLSPAELNIGLGMTYNYKKADDRIFTLAIAPLSYNLKICRNITDIDPTSFGIEAGHHTKHSFGSNFEAKLIWAFTPNIKLSSRLYMFTDYKYVQGDWENTLDLSISKHLTTQLYTHLRFDRSHPRDDNWHYWQFKEILSLGVIYRFATVN